MADIAGAGSLKRRDALIAGTAVVVMTALYGSAARATQADVLKAMGDVLGDRTPGDGRIRLDIPAIAENGFTVPLTVAVDSPMTQDDHVTAVHVFAEGNPLPNVVSVRFTPRSGEAVVSTRIRLARTQTLQALAEMSDGSVFKATREVTVTIGGCGS